MKPPVTIDFETYYSKTFEFSKMTTEEYVRHPEFEIIGVGIKVGNEPSTWHSFSSKLHYQTLLAPYMEHPIIAHNAMFDVAILTWQLGLRPSFIIDTLSMARPHHGSIVGGSLKALSEHYGIGVKGTEIVNALGKHLSDFTSDELAAYGEYCKNDCELTYQLFKLLYKKTPAMEMKLIDKTIRMFTEPKLELDVPLLRDHLHNVLTRKQEMLDKISFDQDVIMSNPKFADALRSYGVEPPLKVSLSTGKDTYAFSKTDSAFTALLEHPKEEVQTLVAARLGVKSTIEETRTESFIAMGERGKLPIPLSYSGANTTMRWSGQDKVNMQNLPRGGALRRAIRAPKGYKVVACDSSNIELRVNHTMAGQHETIAMLRDGKDLYCDFASVLFDREITKADKDERFLGKVSHLGLGYGMSAPKFKETVRLLTGGKTILDDAECERIVKLWRATYDAIPRAWSSGELLLRSIASGGYAEFGEANGKPLVRTFEGGLLTMPCQQIYYPNLRREDKNWVYDSKKFKTIQPVKVYGGKVIENLCQHLARNIIAEQWLKIATRYDVVLQVHDEIVCLVPEDEAEEASRFMVEVMSTSPDWWPEIPLAAESSFGDTYADAK